MEDRETLRSLLEQPVRQVDDEAGVPTPTEVAASWQVMGQRLSGRENSRLNGIGFLGTRWGVVKKQPLLRRLRYAMVGVGACVLAFVLGWHLGIPHRNNHGRIAMSTYVTGNGERASITLPDGNTAVLNVGSHLAVPADYLTGNHTLRLRGEALFTIQHHVGTPITVVAGQAHIQVLGTSFLVRNYTSDTVTTVAVREGKVAVNRVVVVANRLLSVYRNGMTLQRPASASRFSFASGILTLDDLDLSDAVPELDRWYDADIRLADPSLAKRGMSGTFAPGSLADLSGVLALTLDVRVVREGRVLTLYPKR